jgi:hypothetical protein
MLSRKATAAIQNPQECATVELIVRARAAGGRSEVLALVVLLDNRT